MDQFAQLTVSGQHFERSLESFDHILLPQKIKRGVKGKKKCRIIVRGREKKYSNIDKNITMKTEKQLQRINNKKTGREIEKSYCYPGTFIIAAFPIFSGVIVHIVQLQLLTKKLKLSLFTLNISDWHSKWPWSKYFKLISSNAGYNVGYGNLIALCRYFDVLMLDPQSRGLNEKHAIFKFRYYQLLQF